MELHVFYEIFTEKSGPGAFPCALISPVYTVVVYKGGVQAPASGREHCKDPRDSRPASP